MGHRHARTRPSPASLAVITTVLALIGGCTVAAARGTTATTSTTTGPVASTVTSVGPGTTDALLHPRWSGLPAAPIAGRGGGVSVWTGTEMIVWGGTAQGETMFGDGASYHPASRTWQKLPDSTLTPRQDPASVWTGHELFIWGGYGADGTRSDGAVYTPAGRAWLRVPVPPGAPAFESAQQGLIQAVWTGSEVLLLAGRPGDEKITVDLYNPTRNSWTVESPITLPHGHPVTQMSAAAIGSSVYLFSYWSRTQVDPPPRGDVHATTTYYGVDGITLDSVSGSTSPNRLAPPAGTPVGTTILAAGASLLFPAGQPYCGGCAGPIINNRHSVMIDPASGRMTALPHGPIDDLGPQYLWTGSQLLAYDGPQSRSDAAIFTPSTNSWRRLPSAPLAGAGFSVWTGSALLEWGQLYDPKSAKTGPIKTTTAGLELTD